ncbi:hypothetical protein UFOVP447_42 [uncultured Caudovirales phage]|uniref:EF-hand domain-containing protein n=1 Tax=uncultured Caudovirales phage TaxID=2100421 RepID=A0A6J5M7Z8_9CAUD|nr:hypothetical protein UFOVP447_42 [uncultured Caudovirales phage]
MTKTLKDFLEVYKPKSPDEQKFVDKHVVIKHSDRNGNGDDVFKGNTKYIKRKEERKGYDVGDDEKVYEELKGDQHKLDHNKNGKLDAHDFELMRKKKEVAEEVEDLDELSGATLGSYMVKSKKDETARRERGIKVRDEIRKQTGLKVGTPIDPKLYGRKMSRGYNQQVAMKKLTGQARVNATEEVEVVDERFGDGDQRYDTRPEPKPAAKEPKTRLGQFLKKRKEKAAKADMDKLAANYAERQRTYRSHRESVEIDLDDLLGEALDLLNSIDEKTLTPAEMKKREEVVKAIKRENPKMDKSMAYAIATKTAKRVAEDTEELDESAKVAAHLIKRYGDNVRKSHVRSAANDFGVGYVALSHAVRKKLGVTRLQEDEQIDELSKETKASYMKKAGAEIDKLWDKSKTDSRSAHKYYGRKNTMKKIAFEEVEELDEISAKKLTDYAAKASDARGHRDMPSEKLDKRYKSMALAHEKIRGRHAKVAAEGYVPTADEPTEADKKTAQKVRDMMAKEKKPVKEEALDELSKKTMGSYVSKASKSATGLMAGAAAIGAAGGSAHGREMGRTAVKRLKGIDRAVNKLTKEDIINRAVEKYVPEEIKFTPEERLLKRLDGLSESHVATLLGLFEALNSVNQNKMIETVETYEGINSLLNFALENRGE